MSDTFNNYDNMDEWQTIDASDYYDQWEAEEPGLFTEDAEFDQGWDEAKEDQRYTDFYEKGICWCGRDQHYPQHDYYGIYAGRMCDQCFEEKYIQGAYDYAGAGESLDPDW